MDTIEAKFQAAFQELSSIPVPQDPSIFGHYPYGDPKPEVQQAG